MSQKKEPQPTPTDSARATHYCAACERKLPFCVRSDRRFCSSRCRVWAFRNPGQKRPDRSVGRGQPQTLAQLHAELTDVREHIAKVEADVRATHANNQRLRAEIDRLRRLRAVLDIEQEKQGPGEADQTRKRRINEP